MGRGDNDLLFNPPIIKRVEKIPPGIISLLGPGSFPHAAQAILLDQDRGLALQKVEEEEKLVLAPFLGLEESEQEKISDNLRGWNIGDEDLTYSLTSEGFLWLRGETLCFLPRERMSLDADPDLYPLTVSGEILSLHCGQEQFSYLWQDRETKQVYLSSLARNKKQGALSGHDFELEATSVLFRNKGDREMVFFAGVFAEERASLMTIQPDGFGDRYLLDEHADRSLWQGSDKKNLFSPAEEDGTYFYFDEEEGSLCFLDLRRGDNDIIAHDTDLTDKGQIGTVLDLAVFGSRALLLKRGQLSLYDKSSPTTNPVSEIALAQDYTNISFTGNRALLWSKGGREYLELEIT